MGEAASILIKEQNKLGLSSPIKLKADKATDGRHYLNFDFWGIGRKLTADLTPSLKKVMNNQVFWLHDRNQILWNEEVGKWSLLLQK